VQTGCICLRIGTCWGGSYKHGNETSASIKGSKFLDHMSNYQLLRKDSAP
jgi:hypothetical protein